MPEFGFPAQPRQTMLATLISGLRRDSDSARIETVTGRQSDVKRKLDGRITEVLQIEKSIRDIEAYADAIALTQSRTNVMQKSLEQITDVGQLLADQAEILRVNGTDQNIETLSLQARSLLDSVVSALNVDFGGRALFAGDDAGGVALASAQQIYDTATTLLEGSTTSASAIAALESGFLGAGGDYDTTLYVGGSGGAPASDVANGERVNYGVKADEEPIRRLIMNIAAMAAAYDPENAIPDDQRRDVLDFAAQDLRQGISEVIGIRGRLGVAEARIEDIRVKNTASVAALTTSYNELTAVDGYESALRLTELENQLETAFATTARLSRLSLTQFL